MPSLGRLAPTVVPAEFCFGSRAAFAQAGPTGER